MEMDTLVTDGQANLVQAAGRHEQAPRFLIERQVRAMAGENSARRRRDTRSLFAVDGEARDHALHRCQQGVIR